MTLPYNPRAWCWKADDGRIYSSAAGAIVPATDPAFKAWSAAGGVPTVWPRDGAGAQTQAALDAVLAAAGIGTAVPQAVSAAQAMIWLHRQPSAKAGAPAAQTLLDDVTDAVRAADTETQIWFAKAQTWQRTNPHVVAIGKALSLSDAAVDAAFTAAAQITA